MYPASSEQAPATGNIVSEAAEYVAERWQDFLGLERRIVDMQHRAALAAQHYRETGQPTQEAAAKALIRTLGELNILHGKLVDKFQALAPYVGLGAVAVPVAIAAGFSALAVAVLWFFRKVDLQEQLLAQLEAGTLTEAGYLQAQAALGTMPGPLGETLTAGAGVLKWLVAGLVVFALLEGLKTYRGLSANPPLVVFNSNPPGIMSERVWSLAYRHTDDGQDYIHEFGPGVEMEALEDGSVLVRHRRGRPLWRDFEVSD